MPLVSVILPTRDRPDLLPRAVASVLAQTEIDLELILVDNNRATPPLAAESFADPRIRLVRPADCRNAAQARNAALASARGEWISYLDDDDAYRPGKLAAQLALARGSGAALVLCGACFHLRGRRREVQLVSAWHGDELLLRARWNTPMLFHRAAPREFFCEDLSPGEDAEFAQRLLARAGAASVPVAGAAWLDVFPQSGPRVNTDPRPVRRAAARILALRPGFFSPAARRRYVLQTLLVPAKLCRNPLRVSALGARLLRESDGRDWRVVANALAVSLNLLPGRWVS